MHVCKGNNCKTPLEERTKTLQISKIFLKYRQEDLERILSLETNGFRSCLFESCYGACLCSSPWPAVYFPQAHLTFDMGKIENMEYDEESDVYICRNGKRLTPDHVSGIVVCLGRTVSSAADMYLMVIFFESGQIIFEGFHALLKRIKPANYEISKTRRYKNDMGKIENMEYDEESDVYICRNGKRLNVLPHFLKKGLMLLCLSAADLW